MSKFTSAELDYISRPSGWLHGLSLEPVTFYDTQRTWMDGTPGKIFELTKKSRRVGYTYAKSNAAVANCHIHPGSTTIFTSMNLQESYDKIEIAKQAHYNIHPDARKLLVTETKTMLEFAHDAKTVSRIVCMFKPRGQKGRQIFINIDEFDHIQNQEDVLTAAIPNVTHGGSLSIGTSVHGGRRIFDEMWNGTFKEELDPELASLMEESTERIEMPWWMCPYLVSPAWCNNLAVVAREAPKMGTRERVMTFGSKRLKYIYLMMYEDHFIQEYELIPIADGTSVIPWEVITQCTPTGERKEIPESLKALRRGRLGSFADAVGLAENLGGRLWLGYDVGRKRNASELTVDIELPLLGVMYECFYQTGQKVPFNTQKALLRSYLNMTKRAVLTIDATQIGANVSEDLKREFKRRVIEVEFQHYNKLGMFDLLLARMQRLGLILCADRSRMDQLFSVKRKISEAGNVIYYVPRKERHHADKAVSIALANYGRDGVGLVKRGRIAVSKRKGVAVAGSRPAELTPDHKGFHEDISRIAS